MRLFGFVVGLLVGIGLLTIGCSKKQDEVDRLEQEMIGDSGAPGTTMSDCTMVALDTMSAEETMAMDAGAVPEEPQPAELPTAPSGSGFTVQVAGCEDRDYAEHLVGVYRERGFEPFVTNETVEGQLFYRVRIGQFESFSEAQALKSDLADKFSVDAWIDVLQ